MVCRFPEKKFLKNWLKALMLSPGVLFPAGYLLVYLSTHIYLNVEFKKTLSQCISQATGNTWQVSIKSLKPGLILDSVTLNHIEFTQTKGSEQNIQTPAQTITIQSLNIPCPDLEKLLFSHTERVSSTKAVCEKILAEEHLFQ